MGSAFMAWGTFLLAKDNLDLSLQMRGKKQKTTQQQQQQTNKQKTSKIRTLLYYYLHPYVHMNNLLCNSVYIII